MGYHSIEIAKGEYGELSKIQEELNELIDARVQGAKIMELCELSDMIGATIAYLEKYHAGHTIQDLIKMAELTRSAFEDGHRK